MSDHHTSPLRPEDEDLLQVSSPTATGAPPNGLSAQARPLTVTTHSPTHPLPQAALLDPFSVPNLRRVSPSQPAESAPPTTELPPPAAAAAAAAAAPNTAPESLSSSLLSSSSSVSAAAAKQEAWKAEYEAQVVEWRRQSAAVRARAEAERARWEERRAHERTVAPGAAGAGAAGGASVSGQSTSASASEWEAVSQRSAAGSSLAAPGDARAGGQGQSGAHSQAQAQGQGPHPQSNTTRSAANPGAHPPRSSPSAGPQAASGPAAAAADPSDSPHWENVPSSVASSFPSLSFPEPSRPHSPEHSHAPRSATTVRPPTAASVTLAVFDDTLPTRSRFLALLSSLSINLVLPFVNGVMLGFGEIFAKTVVVRWLGWGPSVATDVGLGQGRRSQSRWQWWQ
ncbi:hypothetical protein BJV78DRAFT_1279580 [Lactifluus subvellereus]|nr:hypothetical protein BJV78DRAFT_1279580 [Lactifluus subvellereus]